MRIGSNAHVPFRLDWAKEQQSRDEHVDGEVRTIRGRTWTKTLALACPWCSAVFFVWQADDAPNEPYNDPRAIQPPGMGMRSTCGHPMCWSKEQEFQMKQSESYKNTCSNYWSGKEAKPSSDLKPKAKLSKLGEK